MKEPELFKHKPEDHFLQESEELENYFSNCLDLFCIADTDGYFRKLNKEWENDLGYPVEVLEGRKFLDFVHPDDRTSTLEAVSDLSKGMKIDSFTNRFRAIDGSYRIIEWRSFLSGNKIYASARDVTQREEVEKELRHSEKRYRSLFNNMLEGYALCRMIYVNGEPDDFVYIDVNPKFGQLTGLTNVAGKKVSEVIPGIKESNPELLKIYGKVALTGVPAKFEAFVGPLGIWFSVSVFSPEMDYFVAVFENISERKKTDEALKHSENKYRSIFENAIEGIFQSTLDGRYISANPALARILGDESPEELMKRVTDFEHQFYVDPDRRKQFVKEIEEHEKISDFESQVYNKKGNIIWISENARSVKNSDGNLIGYEGTTIDITERKESEEALRSSQQILEGIINAIPVRVFWKDKDLNYLGCNSSFANDAGFAEPKDIIGKDDYQMGWRDQADLYRSDDLQVIESGFAKTNIEEPQTTPDGNTITLLTSKIPLRNSNGEINGVLGTYLDITERKRAEESLRTNETLLSSAVKIANLGHWENDVINDIFTFNDHFYSMLHTTAEKEGGYKMSSAEYAKRFVHPDDIQMVVDEIMKSIETNDPKFSGRLEHRIKYSDGGAGYISVRYFITKDSSGKTIRVNGVNQDITDRKKYEQELLAAKEHAERSDKLKDAFIANISHEIRTPLNGILGMTALIRNSLSKYAGKEEKDYFSAIENASSRIIRTVDMILNFSRLQVGDFEVRPVQIRMADLTEKIITSHRPKAEAKSIKLSAENLAGDLAVTLDEYCISQAISNLVDNALKYTLQGKIELKLYTKNSNELMLDISDTGIGISGDYLERMFEPYSQEEIGYNRGYEGVGLGLSLVKKYLDLNKCKISVTSTKEVGTVFTINLGKFEKINKSKASIVTNSPVKHVRLNNHAAGLNNKPKILIVEDDRINQFYIISMLKKDYHTESAYNAESALELISKNSFDLVLMDISLKGKMNGLELTRHMRNSDTHKHTPVIAVTGHASAEDKQNCFDAGCNEFIAKPFYENEVLKKIRMFIE